MIKKTSLLLFILVNFLSGCKDNETKILDSKYYLVTKRNNGTSISTYDFQSETLTPDFYTFAPESGAFIVDVDVKGKYGYATTYGQKLLLKKIDLESGADVKSVNAYSPAFIEF